MSNLEFLTYDMVDDEFFKMFKPLYVIMSVLGSVRFKYKDRFVSSTTVLQKMYSFLMMFLVLYSMYYLSFIMFVRNFEYILHGNINKIQFCNLTLMYIIIMVGNKWIYGKQNAELIVTLQHVDRILNKFNESQYMLVFRRNIMLCTVVLSFYLLWYITFCIGLLHNMSQYAVAAAALTGFLVEDFEIFNFSSSIIFLRMKIDQINKVMENRTREKLETKEDDDVWNRLLEAYREVARAFTLLQQIYGPYIFILTVYVCMSLLITVQKSLNLGLKLSAYEFAVITFASIKVGTRPICLGIASHKVNNKIRKTRNYCLILLNKHKSGHIRRKVKNMLRISKVHMCPFSVLGLFSVDARLPLRVLALTTTYTVVLVQFAFNNDTTVTT